MNLYQLLSPEWVVYATIKKNLCMLQNILMWFWTKCSALGNASSNFLEGPQICNIVISCNIYVFASACRVYSNYLSTNMLISGFWSHSKLWIVPIVLHLNKSSQQTLWIQMSIQDSFKMFSFNLPVCCWPVQQKCAHLFLVSLAISSGWSWK